MNLNIFIPILCSTVLLAGSALAGRTYLDFGREDRNSQGEFRHGITASVLLGSSSVGTYPCGVVWSPAKDSAGKDASFNLSYATMMEAGFGIVQDKSINQFYWQNATVSPSRINQETSLVDSMGCLSLTSLNKSATYSLSLLVLVTDGGMKSSLRFDENASISANFAVNDVDGSSVDFAMAGKQADASLSSGGVVFAAMPDFRYGASGSVIDGGQLEYLRGSRDGAGGCS